MVSRLLGGAIVSLCPSYMNSIIYSVIITLYLYGAISFSSMRKCIYCIHIVYHTSFLPPPPLPSFLSHSLPHFSSHPVSSLPLFLCPLFRSSIPGLIDSQLTFICHMRILKVAKLGKVPKYNLENTIYQIVKFTLFTPYCILYNVTFFISGIAVLSELQQRDSFPGLPQTA